MLIKLPLICIKFTFITRYMSAMKILKCFLRSKHIGIICRRFDSRIYLIIYLPTYIYAHTCAHVFNIHLCMWVCTRCERGRRALVMSELIETRATVAQIHDSVVKTRCYDVSVCLGLLSSWTNKRRSSLWIPVTTSCSQPVDRRRSRVYRRGHLRLGHCETERERDSDRERKL